MSAHPPGSVLQLALDLPVELGYAYLAAHVGVRLREVGCLRLVFNDDAAVVTIDGRTNLLPPKSNITPKYST